MYNIFFIQEVVVNTSKKNRSENMLRSLFKKSKVKENFVENSEQSFKERINMCRSNQILYDLEAYFVELQEKATVDMKFREEIRLEIIELCHVLIFQSLTFIRSLSWELDRINRGVRSNYENDREMLTKSISLISTSTHNLSKVNKFYYIWDINLITVEITKAIDTLHTINQLTKGRFNCFDLHLLFEVMPDLKKILLKGSEIDEQTV